MKSHLLQGLYTPKDAPGATVVDMSVSPPVVIRRVLEVDLDKATVICDKAHAFRLIYQFKTIYRFPAEDRYPVMFHCY